MIPRYLNILAFLDKTIIKQDPHGGKGGGGGVGVIGLPIAGSIDNHTFFWLECIATPNSGNGMPLYFGVRTCELFVCLAPFVFLGSFVLTSLGPFIQGKIRRVLNKTRLK